MIHSLYTRIQPNLNRGVRKNKEHIQLQAHSNCWICEGWTDTLVEFKFEFSPSERVDTKTMAVKLHMSTDNYEGQMLELDGDLSKDTQVFSVYRLLPPCKVFYFYTLDGKAEINSLEPQCTKSEMVY